MSEKQCARSELQCPVFWICCTILTPFLVIKALETCSLVLCPPCKDKMARIKPLSPFIFFAHFPHPLPLIPPPTIHWNFLSTVIWPSSQLLPVMFTELLQVKPLSFFWKWLQNTLDNPKKKWLYAWWNAVSLFLGTAFGECDLTSASSVQMSWYAGLRSLIL